MIAKLALDGGTEVRPWISASSCKLTVSDADLNNSTAEGIVAVANGSSSTLTTITNTRIRGSASHGIRLDAGSCSINATTVTGSQQIGVTAINTTLSVQRSLVASNRRGGVSRTGAGTFDVTNNFVFRNGNDADGEFGGLRLISTTGVNKVQHNTIAYNDSDPTASPLYAGGLYCADAAAPGNLIYNNFAGNNTQPNAQVGGSCDTSTSLVSNGNGTNEMHFVAPLIVPFDYHLADALSPAVNTGPATDVNVDFDGQPRPNGLPDVGADELQP